MPSAARMSSAVLAASPGVTSLDDDEVAEAGQDRHGMSASPATRPALRIERVGLASADAAVLQERLRVTLRSSCGSDS